MSKIKSRYLVTLFLLLIIVFPLRAGGISLSEGEMQDKDILVISPAFPGGPNAAAGIQGFRKVWDRYSIQSGIFIEYREISRYPGKAHDERFVRQVAQKYAGKKSLPFCPITQELKTWRRGFAMR